MDNCRFMTQSLNKLVSYLDYDHCKNITGFHKQHNILKVIRCKAVHLYGYMDNWEKFEETKLAMAGISDQDYEHIQQVWNRITPGCENITLEIIMTFI